MSHARVRGLVAVPSTCSLRAARRRPHFTTKATVFVRCQGENPMIIRKPTSKTRRELSDFYLNNQIVGANIPWYHCGWDYGTTSYGTDSGGFFPTNGYYEQFWKDSFSRLRTMGGNTARTWVFFDGRGAPNLSGNYPYDLTEGLDADFLKDFIAMLTLAAKPGIDIQVIPALWSFEAMDDKVKYDSNGKTLNYTKTLGEHRALFSDTDKQDAFVEKALKPLLQEVKDKGLQDTILAWDIINEPEWRLKGPHGPVDQFTKAPDKDLVQVADMQRFVGKCAIAIHEAGFLATLGSAQARWNFENAANAAYYSAGWGCTNFWNDADLRSAAGNNDKAFLDIYQVHYYDYMRDQDTYKSPNDVYSKDGRSAEYYLDTDPEKKRPLLLGEVPGKTSDVVQTSKDNAKLKIAHSKNNKYAGVLFWSFDNGTYEADLAAKAGVNNPNRKYPSSDLGNYTYFEDLSH